MYIYIYIWGWMGGNSTYLHDLPPPNGTTLIRNDSIMHMSLFRHPLLRLREQVGAVVVLCAVVCCGVVCGVGCVVLFAYRYAVLCCAVLCGAVRCGAVWCCAVRCSVLYVVPFECAHMKWLPSLHIRMHCQSRRAHVLQMWCADCLIIALTAVCCLVSRRCLVCRVGVYVNTSSTNKTDSVHRLERHAIVSGALTCLLPSALRFHSCHALSLLLVSFLCVPLHSLHCGTGA